MGSDIPFPVRWYRIPENIYLISRFVYSVYIAPQWRDSAALLKERGISTPTPVRDGKALFIAPHIPGGTLPLEVIPKGTMGTNSIVLRSASAAQQDAELASWLQNAPTLLVNLGSAYGYSKESASTMAQAIQVVLAQTEVSNTLGANFLSTTEQVLAPVSFYTNMVHTGPSALEAFPRLRVWRRVQSPPGRIHNQGYNTNLVRKYHEIITFTVDHDTD